MPRSGHTDTLSRQWELLLAITRRSPGNTVAEIHQKLDDRGFLVSRRTVERDLLSLSTIFPITNNDEVRPSTWRWMDKAGFDLPEMELPDAVTMTVIEDVLRPLLPSSMLNTMEPRFLHAKNRLKALSSTNPKASWIDKVRYVQPAQPLIAPRIHDYVLEVIQECLIEDRQILGEYLAIDQNESQEIRLHPLGLVQRGQITYLVATAFNYDDIRIYALHRMVNAQQLEKRSKRPKEFNLDLYISEGNLHFTDGKIVKLKFKASPLLASYLREAPLSEDMKIGVTSNINWLTVTATVRLTHQLYWWVCNWGCEIVILKPHKLRQNIIKTAHGISDLYKK